MSNANRSKPMVVISTPNLKGGGKCRVIGGVPKGKSGIVRDNHPSKSGYVTLAVVQRNGGRFRTLAKNVVMEG